MGTDDKKKPQERVFFIFILIKIIIMQYDTGTKEEASEMASLISA